MTDALAATRPWLMTAGRGLPDFDHEAFERVALVLLDAMTAAGGPDRLVERWMAALKLLAMTTAASMRAETDEVVREYCISLGPVLAGQVLAFREAASRDEQRGRRRAS